MRCARAERQLDKPVYTCVVCKTRFVIYGEHFLAERRTYEVYLPSVLPANPPMVLMLHGTQKTTSDDAEPIITLNWGWQSVADQYQFILVKPASTYDPNSSQWNWNAYCMDGGNDCGSFGWDGGAFSYASMHRIWSVQGKLAINRS